MTWTPDYLEEMKRRYRIINECRKSPVALSACKKIWKEQPVRFIEDMCWTYDPRQKIKYMPFLLFPRQKEFVQFVYENLENRENGLVEKCRDMGFTWSAVVISTHLWLFRGGTSIGFGSRKQELVDRIGDPDSIIEKVRITIDRLPDFLKPRGFDPRRHAAFMKIINPENDAVITGEIGDNIGRGGRKEIYWKDESAHYERPELIEAALGDNTEVQLDISSVNGSGNVFHRKRMAGQVWVKGQKIERGITRVFIGDWRDDPRKDQEWYDRRRKKAESEGLLHIFAQEIDRDYLSSLDNIIIRPEWVEACIDAHLKLGISETSDIAAGQDIADGGGDKNALAVRKGVILRHCDQWGGEAGDAPKVGLPMILHHCARKVYYDCVGVGTGYKVGVNNLISSGAWPRSVEVIGWNGGESVLDPEKHVIENDKLSPKNKDHYQNLKAQAWFKLRTRIFKTFRAVRHGETYDHKDLISFDSTIPKIHELKSELSQAVYKAGATGKVMVDKSPDGTKSPNIADAVVICYCGKGKLNSLAAV